MATDVISVRPNTQKQDHSTDHAGRKLKRIRETLNLTLRDVDTESQIICERRRSQEYRLNISRLFEIETHNVIPSIYKIYSLSAIYRIDYIEVLNWYGVALAEMPADAMAIPLKATHLIQFDPNHGSITGPLSLDPGVDPRKSVFLNRVISGWGKLPLALLNALETKKFRYGFIGLEDWNMYPLIQPGALVIIDESRRKIMNSGWTNEFERPIYFLQHRDGFACCWCTLSDETLVLQPHPASPCLPQVFKYPQDIDVLGQVTGVATLLNLERRRSTRS